MLSSIDATIVFETLLASPGMNDSVKIDLRLPRRNVLLLTQIIERGLSVKDGDAEGALPGTATPETLEEIRKVTTILLNKAGLADMYDRLNSIHWK